MTRNRPARLVLPRWTAHPGFGVAALFAVAVLLIVHGEPQPSSRPSGKSVVASGSATAPNRVPSTLMIRQGRLELRAGTGVRTFTLPDRAMPLSVITNRAVSVVLAAVGDRQHAFLMDRKFAIVDLGPADGVIPAVLGNSAVIVETASTDPGQLPSSDGTAGQSGDPSTPSATATRSPAAAERSYTVRRYDSAGRPVVTAVALPAGMRAAADTPVGLVAWRPIKLVFDGSIPLEPLSATATLIRPDGTLRSIGAVFPLASTTEDLLVWSTERHEFGLMPLEYVTSEQTKVNPPSTSGTSVRPPAPTGSAATRTPAPPVPRTHPRSTAAATAAPDASPSVGPTSVAGTRWYAPTRGFTVTGPASFTPDGSAFAVYAQVGTRRRLVVGQVGSQLNDQIEVLALSPAPALPTTSSSTANPSLAPSASTSSSSASPSPSTTSAAFTLQGFPFPAPLQPEWWDGQVVGLGNEGTVVGYQPGKDQAVLLDLGFSDIKSLADAP